MIVPQYWAEGRIQQQVAGQQVTVRRFGWSDDSPVAAQAHADQRTREAFERIASGETTLARRERKRAYNGADGMPIREEILERHGDTVITRNGYGARCLNTPDVMFMDIDFERPMTGGAFGYAVAPALIAGLLAGYTGKTWIGGLIAALVVFAVAYRIGLKKQRGESDGNPAPEKRAAKRIGLFLQQHPEWHLRVYRTPAGFRLLAMHDVFSPATRRWPTALPNSAWTPCIRACASTRTAFGRASRPSPGASASTSICGRNRASGPSRPTSSRSATPGSRATRPPPRATPPASFSKRWAARRCTRRRLPCSGCTIHSARPTAACRWPDHRPHIKKWGLSQNVN